MMNSREKAMAIFNRKSNGEGVMWTGHPNWETVPIFAKEWGIDPVDEAIYEFLEDDCRWVWAESAYRPKLPFGPFDARLGTLAEAETLADVEKFPWPNVEDSDFTDVYAALDQHQDKMIFTGMWCPFFHVVADLFGMEKYFINMYENPALVEAVTERVVDFYIGMNEKFFPQVGDRADVMFFGNDFGTQLDLFVSPDKFREFVLPSFKRIVNTGKKYGKKIMLHSCGSIYRVIPDLIDAGVDILHPIQAQAAGMSASDLAQYKNDLSFVGGIDAQSFFVNATPQEIKDEVYRVREILGPNIIISPSHEEILPNVPAANVLAMAQAAHGRI